MENKEKYVNLLHFFDSDKFDHNEIADVINNVITLVKEKGGDHQAACAWVIMVLYKRDKCNTLQFEEIIDEFNIHMEGLDDYIDSLVMEDKVEGMFTYYNGYLQKKIKGV